MKNLKIGSEPSLDIVRLQLQLRHLDIFKNIIDGKFSENLEICVKRFQNKLGLSVDGIAGAFTQTQLLKMTKDKLFVLFIHCAASREGQHFSAHQIELMHTLPKNQGGRGWSRAGYSDIFELDKLVNIRAWNQDDMISDWEYSFGVKSETLLNFNSRHICYIGGMDKNNKFPKDTRTEFQRQAMETYIKFTLLYNPKIVIAGHHQVQNKACPSFIVPDYLREIQIPEFNIANWGNLGQNLT